MTSLSQSAFLQALGWAIANSLWQMALLWALYQLCFVVFRRAQASVKTTAATVLLFTGFIWFLFSLVGHYLTIQFAGAVLGGPSQGFSYSLTSVGFRADTLLYYMNEWLGKSEYYLPYLSFAYLLVLSFLLIKVGKAYRHIQEIRSEGLAKIDANWRMYVQDLAYRLGITREIRVWLSDKIDIPATVGYLKPLVLLPIASFNHLTTEQVEAILLHELAHIKRHDYLLNLVITVVETILFFNPFAQLITRHIKTERENSCDDFVLQFQFSPRAYAAALLSLEKQRVAPELAMMAAGKTDLLDRVRRIMNVQTRSMNYGQKLMALLITACILSSLAWLTPGMAPVKAMPSPKEMAVLSIPVRMASVVPDGLTDQLGHKDESADLAWPTSGMADTLNSVATASKKAHNLKETGPCKIEKDSQIKWEKAPANPNPDPEEGSDVYPAPMTDMTLDASNDALPVADSSNREFRYKLNAGEFEVGNTKDLNLNLSPAQLDKIKLALAKAKKSIRLAQTGEIQINQLRADLENRQVQVYAYQDPRHSSERSVLVQRMQSKLKKSDARSEQYWAGIEADQPGWKTPEIIYPAPTVRSLRSFYVPVKFNFSAQSKLTTLKGVTNALHSMNNSYKEKLTLYKAASDRFSADAKQPTHAPDARHAYINYFLKKMAVDGILPPDSLVRIVRDGNELIINNKVQSDAIYSRYKPYFSGKSVLIVTNGETIQITIN